MKLRQVIFFAFLLLPVQAFADTLADLKDAYTHHDWKSTLRLIPPVEGQADKGDRDAQMFLGYMYENGGVVSADSTKAKKWYEKAAGQGDIDAMWKLGSLSTDPSEAKKWYETAADQGGPQWQTKLGQLFMRGSGSVSGGQKEIINPDSQEALKWYRKAADEGDPDAEYQLSRAEKNPAESSKWLNKSAEGGNIFAQLDIAAMYEDGKGVRQDYAEAMKWYLKAADRIVEPYDSRDLYVSAAMFKMSQMYEKGHGVKQDLIQAYKWRDLGVHHGMAGREDPVNSNLLAELNNLSKTMSPAQVSEAKKLVDEWNASHIRHSAQDKATPP